MNHCLVNVELVLSRSVLTEASRSDVLSHLSAFVDARSSSYPWNRDRLDLSSSSVSMTSNSLIFTSSVDVGLNLGDTWFVVHLLRLLSREHADLRVHLSDEDGEFLLIEASGALPGRVQDTLDDMCGVFRGGKFFIVSKLFYAKAESSWVQTSEDILADRFLARLTRTTLRECRALYRTWVSLPSKRLALLFQRHSWLLSSSVEASLSDSPLITTLLATKIRVEENGDPGDLDSSDGSSSLRTLCTLRLTRFQYCLLLREPEDRKRDMENTWSSRDEKATRVGERLTFGFRVFRHLESSDSQKEEITSLLERSRIDLDDNSNSDIIQLYCDDVEDVVKWPQKREESNVGQENESSSFETEFFSDLEAWMSRSSGWEGIDDSVGENDDEEEEEEEEGECEELVEMDEETMRVMQSMDEELGLLLEGFGGMEDDDDDEIGSSGLGLFQTMFGSGGGMDPFGEGESSPFLQLLQAMKQAEAEESQ